MKEFYDFGHIKVAVNPQTEEVRLIVAPEELTEGMGVVFSWKDFVNFAGAVGSIAHDLLREKEIKRWMKEEFGKS